jgi:uncharacterized oligopeptide transporter (OPT) family protein
MSNRYELARAVGTGVILGALLGVCNTAMGLRVGWFDTGSLTAALLGGAALRAAGRPATPEHQNLLQTLASSMATMPSTAGLIAAVPVLTMVGHSQGVVSLLLWAVACGGWGVLWALPLRQRLLVDEALPFPTGQATAQAITAVTRAGQAETRVRLFLGALAAAALVTGLREAAAMVPAELGLTVGLLGVSAATLGLAFSVSPLSLGAGLMGGALVGASLLGAGLVARLALAPVLVHLGLVVDSPESLSAWLLWPGVGLLVGSTLPSLARLATLVRRTKLSQLALSPAVLVGLALCLAVLLGVAWWWGASVPAVGVSALVGVPLMIASTRAAGQTDVAPLAPMGQLGQVVGAVTASGLVTTVTSGAIPAGAGAHTANTLWTLKAGRILGVRDEPQLIAQLVGVPLGALVCVPAFLLMTGHAVLGSSALPVPWAAQWRAIAEMLSVGGAAVPHGAGLAAGVGVLVGLVVGALEERGYRTPSAVALGLGLLLPLSTSATMALGGALEWWLKRRGTLDSVGLPLSAGLIAGESLLSVGLMSWAAAWG